MTTGPGTGRAGTDELEAAVESLEAECVILQSERDEAQRSAAVWMQRAALAAHAIYRVRDELRNGPQTTFHDTLLHVLDRGLDDVRGRA